MIWVVRRRSFFGEGLWALCQCLINLFRLWKLSVNKSKKMSDIHPQLFTSVTWKTRHRNQNPYLFKWSLSVKVQIYLLLKQGHLRCKADSLVFKFKATQLIFVPVFGLLQLSPALRNRFTEIWCPPSNARADLIQIIEHNIKPGVVLKSANQGTKL